jgi:enoyl-CoA hydratase/carnithine racemase
MTDGDSDPTAHANDDLIVAVSDDGLVVRATIDRPEKRNALNEAVMRGLLDVAETVDESEARVLVIEAAGTDVFSAGGDFTEMPIGGSAQEFRESFSGLAVVMAALRDASALTVAAVEGDCLAGGLGLAAACEFIVATESAAFATPEVRVGLFPVQAMVSIMRTVPEKRGLRMLFTGERVGADDAHDMGLVTAVHPDDAFAEELEAFADTLAASSPVMIAMGKEAYYHQAGLDFERALDYAREVIALMAMSEDTEEGIEAQLMDREPEWAGR